MTPVFQPSRPVSNPNKRKKHTDSRVSESDSTNLSQSLSRIPAVATIRSGAQSFSPDSFFQSHPGVKGLSIVTPAYAQPMPGPGSIASQLNVQQVYEAATQATNFKTADSVVEVQSSHSTSSSGHSSANSDLPNPFVNKTSGTIKFSTYNYVHVNDKSWIDRKSVLLVLDRNVSGGKMSLKWAIAELLASRGHSLNVNYHADNAQAIIEDIVKKCPSVSTTKSTAAAAVTAEPINENAKSKRKKNSNAKATVTVPAQESSTGSWICNFSQHSCLIRRIKIFDDMMEEAQEFYLNVAKAQKPMATKMNKDPFTSFQDMIDCSQHCPIQIHSDFVFGNADKLQRYPIDENRHQ